MNLRIHHFLAESRANGPGKRCVLWVQGCSLGCSGCFNPQTHAFGDGQVVPVDEVFGWIRDHAHLVQGLTVTGGEPLQQAAGVAALLRRVKTETQLSILLLTGFSWAEIEQLERIGSRVMAEACRQILDDSDVIIAGPYRHDKRLARGLLGSANKTVHFRSTRYGPADLALVPPAEIQIAKDGSILMTGIDPLQLGFA